MRPRSQSTKRQSREGIRETKRRRRGDADPLPKALEVKGSAKMGNRVIRAVPSSGNSGSNVFASKELRERLTLHLPVSLIERAKNAVYWTPGLTMTDLAMVALAETLSRMEKKRGKAFPLRNGNLRIGRPLKGNARIE